MLHPHLAEEGSGINRAKAKRCDQCKDWRPELQKVSNQSEREQGSVVKLKELAGQLETNNNSEGNKAAI